jgi:hypothetical protein
VGSTNFGAQQAAPVGGEGIAAANMLGNLLGAGKSVSFFLSRDGTSGYINTVTSSNVINPHIADNNSPIPQDRVYYRYNYFNHAEQLSTLTNVTVPSPELAIGGTSRLSAVRSFDVNQQTFGAEKTFLDGLFSAEVRVPFSTTLSSNLDYRVASANGIGPTFVPGGQQIFTDPVGNLFFFPGGVPAGGPGAGNIPYNQILTTPTPQNTRGSEDTEFGNMSVILKGLLFRSDWLSFSGGVGVGIPTAQDTRVRVTDYVGGVGLPFADEQRVRTFNVANDTWGLAPFLAFLATPSDRLYVQGFVEVEVPLNKSTIGYTETLPIIANPSIPTGFNTAAQLNQLGIPSSANILLPPFAYKDHIRDQTLLDVDLGAGYWVYRDSSCGAFLTGLAPTVEVHYTHSLNKAQLVELPRDSLHLPLPTGIVAGNDLGQFVNTPNFGPNAPSPTVGSQRGPIDIVDLTAGVTALFGNNFTVATGFSFPLTQNSNRTFDWEYTVQLNYYFGAPRSAGSRFTPTTIGQ